MLFIATGANCQSQSDFFFLNCRAYDLLAAYPFDIVAWQGRDELSTLAAITTGLGRRPHKTPHQPVHGRPKHLSETTITANPPFGLLLFLAGTVAAETPADVELDYAEILLVAHDRLLQRRI